MNKLSIFIFLVYFLFGFHLMRRLNEKLKKEAKELSPKSPEKRCPAHNWSFKDNQNGGTYISCNWCHKMPGQLSDTSDWS